MRSTASAADDAAAAMAMGRMIFMVAFLIYGVGVVFLIATPSCLATRLRRLVAAKFWFRGV